MKPTDNAKQVRALVQDRIQRSIDVKKAVLADSRFHDLLLKSPCRL